MQQANHHPFLVNSPWRAIVNSSSLLMPAIFMLLLFDVLESSLIATHSDNSLSLFGYFLPLVISMNAVAIAIAVRSNMILVKEQHHQNSFIPTLFIFTFCVTSVLLLLMYFFKDSYSELVNLNNWLLQFNQAELAHYQSEIALFYEYKIASFLPLVLVWQSSSMMRALGWCHFSAMYLLAWMTSKTLLMLLVINSQSLTLISDLAQLHFVVDSCFALLAMAIFIVYKRIDFKVICLKTLFSDKRISLLLTLQQLAPALSLFILTIFMSRIGTEYIGAFAIVFRLEMLLLALPMVFTASIPALVGINYWAKQITRCKQIISHVLISLLLVQSLISILLLIFKSDVLFFLCPDCEQKRVILNYLNYVPLTYFFLAVALLAPSCLNAIGCVQEASKVIIIHRLVSVPLLGLGGVYFAGSQGLFIGLSLAHAFIGLYVLYRYKKQVNIRLRAHDQGTNAAIKQGPAIN
jgi:hypothetical protein